MSLFDSTARAERQHAADLARIDALRAEESALVAQRPPADDFDALVAADEANGALNALRRKIAIAVSVAEHSAGVVREARLEADRAAARTKNAEMTRKARQAEKRVRGIAAAQAALADEIAWLAEHVEEFDRYNRFERGDLPYVPDAEARVRHRPASVEPAVVEKRQVWRNSRGEAPSIFATNASGERVPSGRDAGAYRLVTEKVVVRPEQTIHGRMPERISEAVQLVALHGERLWPR